MPSELQSIGMTTFELPVVDFSPFIVDGGCNDVSSNGKSAVAASIDQACRNHGFVCLRNTGISRVSLENAFEASKNLFSMANEAKEKLKQLDPTTNTGYSGLGSEALNRRRSPDLKEVFNVRKPQHSNEELFQGTPTGFQPAVSKLWEEVTFLSKKFSECCAMALGLELDYFAKTMKEMDLCTMRMLCYPPCPATDPDDAKNSRSAIRVGEHTDFGLCTFLFVHKFHEKSSHGLQVKPIEGGDLGRGSLVNRDDDMFTSGWKDVIFDEGMLELMAQDDTCPVLVNTGALMARWTNDIWRATAHRVIVKPEARNHFRYSIAFFFDPDKSTVCAVHPKFVKDGDEPKYPPINSFDYLLMKLQEAQGIKDDKRLQE